MRNKLAAIFLSALLAVSGIALFTACAPEEDKWTVTFQDGETVLFTQKVEQGLFLLNNFLTCMVKSSSYS